MKPIQLNRPKPARVMTESGIPVRFEGAGVESIREEWLVEEGWWSRSPLSRRYFELLLDDGRIQVVFCDLTSGRWFSQRA